MSNEIKAIKEKLEELDTVADQALILIGQHADILNIQNKTIGVLTDKINLLAEQSNISFKLGELRTTYDFPVGFFVLFFLTGLLLGVVFMSGVKV